MISKTKHYKLNAHEFAYANDFFSIFCIIAIKHSFSLFKIHHIIELAALLTAK